MDDVLVFGLQIWNKFFIGWRCRFDGTDEVGAFVDELLTDVQKFQEYLIVR